MSAEIKGYKDTPQLPGVPYCVHDSLRPQPPVIQVTTVCGARPPSDATVLFDGRNLDAWTRKDGLEKWEIRDGAMVATGSDIYTKESFGAVQLHVEWRVPAGRHIDGQEGGNSGVFLMDRYEVQVLQSHENPTYPDGQAGALYGQMPPLVNSSTRQGEWQTYDIAFEPPVYKNEVCVKPAKITVLHNGLFVQHGELLLGPTEHRSLAHYPQSHPATAPLKLQYHGDPVEFRNIWLRPLVERK